MEYFIPNEHVKYQDNINVNTLSKYEKKEAKIQSDNTEVVIIKYFKQKSSPSLRISLKYIVQL